MSACPLAAEIAAKNANAETTYALVRWQTMSLL
jgi:hypothetical protein